MHTAKPIPFCLTIISALVLVSALEAQADQHAKAEIKTSETEAPPNPNEVGLSLREAVDLAIENNLGVEVARHAPLIASEDVDIAWGAYDPVLSGGMSYANARTPNTSPFNTADAIRNKNRNGNAKLTGLVPLLGATVSMDYVGTRAETNQRTSSLTPQWDSGLAFKASVPLLRGLVWNNPWTQVKVTNLLRESSLETFRADLMDTVLVTVRTYWQLVAQQEQLRVAKKSYQTSLALLDQTKIQYEVGVKSKVEVIQAEAGVAERELEVINTEARYQNSQDALIDTVYGVRLTPDSMLQIAPTDSPSDFDEIQVDREVAAQLAAENRPELANLKLEIERQEVLVRFRKNQRLPQLDLNVSYGTSGIEGKGNPDAFNPDRNALAPPGTGGNFSDTHDQWFEKRGGREYAVGGVISIPLGNYGPRHSVSKARLELRRAKTQLLALNQNIILEVRRDIRLFEAARKGIDASERQRIAAQEQLRAERIRLEHGESTPFDVLLKESDLVNAEVSKIRALQLYRTSAANLDRRQGTILRSNNIVVGSVGGLRNGMEPESFGLRDILDPINPTIGN
jgi:outer membrane protein TolC